jgi:hypothetical protein
MFNNWDDDDEEEVKKIKEKREKAFDEDFHFISHMVYEEDDDE